jgi:hypothetical protein
MDIHKNARCPRAGRKWRDRFEPEGLAGLQDRSSRPHRLRYLDRHHCRCLAGDGEDLPNLKHEVVRLLPTTSSR